MGLKIKQFPHALPTQWVWQMIDYFLYINSLNFQNMSPCSLFPQVNIFFTFSSCIIFSNFFQSFYFLISSSFEKFYIGEKTQLFFFFINTREHNSLFTSCISYMILLLTHHKMWIALQRCLILWCLIFHMSSSAFSF